MGWYVYTSIPFSSFTSAYIELKPSREQRDARSTNIDRDLVGVFANGKGDSGKAILGWSIARCGNLLSFYSLILEPGPGSPSDDVEDGVSLLEYKLPSAAIGGPIMIGQHNEGLYCAAILCEDLSLSTFDIRMTQRGLLATSTESIITHDLRKELRTLEFDKHSIENDLLVCPCDSNCGFIAKNDGSIFALSYSKKLVANFEKPEMKLRRITGGLSSWRISPEMIKNCTTPVKPDFSSAKLLGLGVIPLENYYFLVCAFEKLLFLIDVRRERVRCCVDFSNICDKGLSLYGVTLSNTDYPVKCFKGASEVFVFIHVKSSNRSEGLLVYSVKTGLLLHPAKKDSLYPFELASFLDFPDAFNASSGAKLLDFECLSLHKGSKTASYHVLCLLKTELCQMIALAELEFKIPTVVSWKEISLGNLHPEGFCSRLKNLSTDEALDVVFDGSVEYPILREAVLDFVEQGNAQKSFIDFTYSLEKLKSITYYAITNEARRVIFDLYGENYSHTLGNEKLHKTIIDNVAHMFLESIDSQIVRGRTPICIRYDQNSSSILLFGLRSFGVLRDRTHFEYFKLPSSTLELGKTLEHDSISLAKDLSMLVHRVPLTPQTVSAVVKVLLYKEYGGDIQDLFCELAAYSFKDACAIDTQNFISTYSSIPNRDCFFLEIINQVNLTRSNFEHRGGDQPAQKMGSLPLLRAQLAIEVYAQISVAMYETVLDVILTILYAYFVGNRNGIDLRLDSKTLGTAIIQLNNAALHKILSSDNGRIHKEKSNGNSNRSTSTSPQLDEKQHTYSESPRIEPNTDPHAYYDKLNINSSSSLNIYINKPAISRSNLLCLFNSYKCFDSTFSSIMRSNIVHIALQFMHNLKPFFNMAYHLLCSTKDSVILLLELIKLGNNNIVREIVKICTRNPLISYIRGRYASEDGDFNTAKKCFEHFSSYMINSSSSNNPFPIELLCGILPDYIIQSRNPYRYYMHVINDCSTSKHDRRCPSFIIYFANLALSVHNNIQEPRSMHCIKETLLQRMFDSYLEMGDLCGCFDVMAEFSQNFNILHLIQRILRYCTDNKMLGDLISKYPIAPYGELFISEMVKFFRAMSPTDQPGECFKYANSLFSLYIREKDHRRALMECLKTSFNDSNKSHKYIDVLCQSYQPVIYVLKQLPCEDAWFSLLSEDLSYIQEIEVEYGRIFAVQNTLYHYGEELVKNGFSSNEEALRLYVACEDYERAFDFATKCNLGYEDIFISLTDMCLRYHAEDPPDLPGCMVTPPNYLSAGDADVIQHQMVSPSEKLWMLLKKRLDELNDLVGNYRYHVVVAEHVLKSQKINDLPFWIRNTLKVFVHKVIIYLDPMLKFPLFKNNCMDKLLKLYLDHSDALSAASILVKEMEKRKDTVVKEGNLNNANNISPYLIDRVLIRIREILVKNISRHPGLQDIASEFSSCGYDFDTYPNVLLLIKNNQKYSKLPESDHSLLECALQLHENICQYLKAVKTASKAANTTIC